ncbi:hypothetical protein M9458_002817, partial [Cirrhinus mrigala]
LVLIMEAVCELSASPENPKAPKYPPTLLLLSLPPLSSGGPSAHPQPSICAMTAEEEARGSPVSACLCHQFNLGPSGSNSSPWLIGSSLWAPLPPLVGPLSSLRRLHHESPFWLWSGSHLAPPAPSLSCFLPGSSLHRHHPGLWPSPGCSSFSRASFQVPTRSSCVVNAARGRAFWEGGDMSHPWLVFVFVFLPMCSMT